MVQLPSCRLQDQGEGERLMVDHVENLSYEGRFVLSDCSCNARTKYPRCIELLCRQLMISNRVLVTMYRHQSSIAYRTKYPVLYSQQPALEIEGRKARPYCKRERYAR